MRLIHTAWDSNWEHPLSVTHELAGEELEQARAVLAAQLRPCGGQHAGKYLAKMKLLMAGRNMADADKDAWFLAMLEELAPLPADLVTKACETWMRSERWLPTLADLLAEMEPDLTRRRLTRDALLKPAAAPPAQVAVKRADPEHVARLVARLREKLA